MLAAEHRLTSGEEFRRAVRRGRRAGSRLLVVHLAEHAPEAGPARPGAGPRVGFVVSRSVGGAVVRNRVKRRLRHLARERLASLPGSVVLVVRAQPPSAEASYQELGAALDRCLERLTRPGSGGAGRREPQEVGA